MKHVFIFGASTVHGVGGRQGGWADRIKMALHSEMFAASGQRQYEVYELGVSGAMLQDVQARFENEVRARVKKVAPDDVYVIFSAGVNDSIAVDGPDRFLCTPDDFAALVHSFLHLVKDYTQHVMAVGFTPIDESKTTPFLGGRAHFTNQRLVSFEQALVQACSEQGVACLPLMAEAPADWASKYTYADGLHPSDAGYDWIFNRIQPDVRTFLGQTA